MIDTIDTEVRVCRVCDVSKPATEFHRGYRCKDCHRAYCRDYYYTNRGPLRERKRMPTEEQKERKRKAAYLKRYGITEDQRDELLAAQGGACAICGTTSPGSRGWCTDHDHACCPVAARSCGQCIRGILCYGCNTLLGHAKDRVTTLSSAIEYLTRSARA